MTSCAWPVTVHEEINGVGRYANFLNTFGIMLEAYRQYYGFKYFLIMRICNTCCYVVAIFCPGQCNAWHGEKWWTAVVVAPGSWPSCGWAAAKMHFTVILKSAVLGFDCEKSTLELLVKFDIRFRYWEFRYYSNYLKVLVNMFVLSLWHAVTFCMYGPNKMMKWWWRCCFMDIDIHFSA